MGGTIKGSRYIYRNRGRENGSPVLSFNCKKDGDNLEEYAEIKLLLSTDFDGDITSRIHPVSYALKGDEGEGTRYEYATDGNCIRLL